MHGQENLALNTVYHTQVQGYIDIVSQNNTGNVLLSLYTQQMHQQMLQFKVSNLSAKLDNPENPSKT